MSAAQQGSSSQLPQSMQVYTQVVTPSGEVQQIPIQLTASQIQAITLQMQGKQPNQPIVIQTPVDPNDNSGYVMMHSSDWGFQPGAEMWAKKLFATLIRTL